MTADLYALAAHARSTPATQRARLAKDMAAHRPAGSVLLVTCHRVELYGSRAAAEPPSAGSLPHGAEMLDGHGAASHLVRVAVGLESAVVAEDQVLHQLRQAVQEARTAGGLPADLDRLFDLALRAGRRARSWLPGRRVNLAELALGRVLGRAAIPDAPVLVVGTGQMGRLAAANLLARGARVLIASRTPERARGMAAQLECQPVAFDPEPATLAGVAGIIVALAGQWPLSDPASATLLRSSCWVIDLSAPPALDEGLRAQLGTRLITIDDLADAPGDGPSDQLLARLDALAEATLNDYVEWSASEVKRAAARALSRRAAAVGSAELAQLWQRAPTLDDGEREEIERTVRELTRRLLRDPLERLSEDGDGRHARAARELFRL